MRPRYLARFLATAALALLGKSAAFAQGTIYFHNPEDIRVFSDGATPSIFDLDFDGNGSTDYTFRAVDYFQIEPAGINEVIATRTGGGDIGGPVSPLSMGTAINGTAAPPGEWIGAEEFFFPQGGSAIIYPYFHVRSTIGTLGPWQDSVNAYIGVRFAVDERLHYGWIKLLIPDTIPDNRRNGGIIEEWAYNTIPGQPILAGQVPEPSTWAFVVVGGLALFVVKTRRRTK